MVEFDERIVFLVDLLDLRFNNDLQPLHALNFLKLWVQLVLCVLSHIVHVADKRVEICVQAIITDIVWDLYHVADGLQTFRDVPLQFGLRSVVVPQSFAQQGSCPLFDIFLQVVLR